VHAPESPKISVCIATYRRNAQLGAVLDDLKRQQRLPDQVVIVDNDAAGGARPVVEQFRAAGAPFVIDYDIQPEPNIALTRNRTVELARGEWLAFIDDDERAPEQWCERLVHAARIYEADGVLAPVEPQVPPSAPAWIRRGRFYDFPHQPNGAAVPLNCMRFGNVLLRAAPLRALAGPFDPRFGLRAGEDVDVLVRLARQGATIVWYEDAPVFEPVEARRLSLRWLLLRALSGGQGFARATVGGFFRPIGLAGRCLFFLRALAQLIVAAGLAVLSVPFGRHHAAAWLIKAYANLGKLSVLWGWQYRAYARNSNNNKRLAPHES
jgi:succinoglycan biosynthesis protein ExoM